MFNGTPATRFPHNEKTLGRDGLRNSRVGEGKTLFQKAFPSLPPTSIKSYAQASSIRSREALAGAESSLGTVMGSVFPATMPSNVARSFSGVIFAMLEQALERRASTRMRPSCSRARRYTRLISVPT